MSTYSYARTADTDDEDVQDKRLADRAEKEWKRYTGGLPIKVEVISGAIYAFGEELAVLRLFHRMKGAGRALFSKTHNSWVYAQDRL
jgi:hypothetical protein